MIIKMDSKSDDDGGGNTNNETNKKDLSKELVKCIIYAIVKKGEKIKRNKIKNSINDMILYALNNKINFNIFKEYQRNKKKECIINMCNCTSYVIYY